MTSPVFQLASILIGCITPLNGHSFVLIGCRIHWDWLLLVLCCLLKIFGYYLSPLTRGAEINRGPFSATTYCAAGSFCVLCVSQNCDLSDHNAVKLEVNHKEN